MLICSSNSECITIADAPASSSLRKLSSSFVNGEAEATTGFFSCSPRYLVERLVITRSLCSRYGLWFLHFGCWFRAVAVRRSHCPLLVQLPAIEHVLLRLFQQLLRNFRIRMLQHRVTRFVVDVLFQRH